MMRQYTAVLLYGLVMVAVAGTSAANATQLALVNQDAGHAVLFTHNGHCYALLPSHVSPTDRFALEMPLQRLGGSGRAFLRDEANDLAIALVSGDVATRCQEPWQSFPSDISRLLERASRAEVVRLGPEGIQDRTDAVVVAFDPDHITVATTDTWAPGEIYQGTSGSVLEIDGTVSGIAQTAIDQRNARFFRIDRIVALAAPFVSHPGAEPEAIPPSGEAGLGFVFSAWTPGEQGAPADALQPGALESSYVVPWTGKPVEIEITLDMEAPVPVRRITLASNVSADHTPPKAIAIAADVGSAGQPFWRSLGQSDMPPSGVLTIETGGTVARRLRFTVQSVWQAERPMRLDSLTVE